MHDANNVGFFSHYLILNKLLLVTRLGRWHCWFLGSQKIFFKQIWVGRSDPQQINKSSKWCPIDIFSSILYYHSSFIIPVFDHFVSYYVYARLKLDVRLKLLTSFCNSSITFWGIPLIWIFNFSEIQLNF